MRIFIWLSAVVFMWNSVSACDKLRELSYDEVARAKVLVAEAMNESVEKIEECINDSVEGLCDYLQKHLTSFSKGRSKYAEAAGLIIDTPGDKRSEYMELLRQYVFSSDKESLKQESKNGIAFALIGIFLYKSCLGVISAESGLYCLGGAVFVCRSANCLWGLVHKIGHNLIWCTNSESEVMADPRYASLSGLMTIANGRTLIEEWRSWNIVGSMVRGNFYSVVGADVINFKK